MARPGQLPKLPGLRWRFWTGQWPWPSLLDGFSGSGHLQQGWDQVSVEGQNGFLPGMGFPEIQLYLVRAMENPGGDENQFMDDGLEPLSLGRVAVAEDRLTLPFTHN